VYPRRTVTVAGAAVQRPFVTRRNFTVTPAQAPLRRKRTRLPFRIAVTAARTLQAAAFTPVDGALPSAVKCVVQLCVSEPDTVKRFGSWELFLQARR
jgi:hypothetical protein